MKSYIRFIALTYITLISACQPVTTAIPLTPNINTITPVLPTGTPILPSPTLARIPPALPQNFGTDLLNPLDVPQTYVKDTCQYLKDKWDPNHASPGTVVMVVALQSITKYHLEANDSIETKDFDKLMVNLHKQGFETINMQQLKGFLYNNEKIPNRSVMIIQDGQRRAGNYNGNIRAYWNEWGWKVVNAWTSQPETEEAIWQENIALEKEGWVDHQAYGITTNITLTDKSPDERFEKEFNGSMDAFQKRFNKKPIAFIWPGGAFGTKPVQAARTYGYQLGFTLNTRGPLMYNWIPLAEKADDFRPSFPPETQVGDPLMVLPRYWAKEAVKYIDQVRIIGKRAAAYAEQHKETELEYYDIVCAPSLGTLPTAVP